MSGVEAVAVIACVAAVISALHASREILRDKHIDNDLGLSCLLSVCCPCLRLGSPHPNKKLEKALLKCSREIESAYSRNSVIVGLAPETNGDGKAHQTSRGRFANRVSGQDRSLTWFHRLNRDPAA